MKKVILSLLVVASCSVFAQNTAKDFFSKNEMVWFGLNFSEAKMVGQFDQGMGAAPATGSDIKNKWISGWNGIVIAEPKNFKLKESFHKDEVYFDLSPNEKLNSTIKSDEIMTFNTYEFKDAQKTIKQVVSKLTGGDKTEGLGVVFVVESFDKGANEATAYVTIFDIKTKNILVTEKVKGTPKGIGLRNFWAGAIKDMINKVNSTYYSNWKSNAK